MTAPLILSSKPMAENCRKSPLVLENTPRISALSGVCWKTFGPTRVKHRTMLQNRRIALLCGTVLTGSAGGIRLRAVDLTAELPQGEMN